ncbi:nitrilase-related carbon-nitrogen hydrolase [Shewanella dokdonensis]|uniref:nitrilase-related carbon-nitrogen hydrolase n=1 Tax=Shewanella dokdonensis TaxID=712036 RepID=UPI002467ED96|nr:nitrilase-related carbon-nitrogen hydrolase [Shewanella dokdonensis]
MAKVKVAATQMACSWDIESNVMRAEKLVRQAAAEGAQIILIQELFEAPISASTRVPNTLPWHRHWKTALLSNTSKILPENCKWYCRCRF